MNKKGELGLILNFFMGLIVTLFLVIFAYRILTTMLFPVGPEKHLIEAWAKDIENAPLNRLSQLIMIPESLEDFAFVFFNNDIKEVTLPKKNKRITGRTTFDELEDVKKHGRGGRLCAFNTERGRLTYCTSISANFFIHGTESFDFFIITSIDGYGSEIPVVSTPNLRYSIEKKDSLNHINDYVGHIKKDGQITDFYILRIPTRLFAISKGEREEFHSRIRHFTNEIKIHPDYKDEFPEIELYKFENEEFVSKTENRGNVIIAKNTPVMFKKELGNIIFY